MSVSGLSVNDVSILSRSLLIILPLSPEPLIVERSIFLSAAIFLANGDAKTRLSETVTSSLRISVSPTFSDEVSATEFSLSLITAGSELKLASAFSALISTEEIIAINSSTLTVSPTLTPIWINFPTWKDSNSIVALSVSISAKISPSFTSSPTFFNHDEIVPSSIVSLNLGIVIYSTLEKSTSLF